MSRFSPFNASKIRKAFADTQRFNLDQQNSNSVLITWQNDDECEHSKHAYRQRLNSQREVRATLVLTLFLLSQWALPQAILLQGMQGRASFVTSAQAAGSTSRGMASPGIRPSKGGTPKRNSPISTTEPAWYRASRLKDVRRASQMEKQGRLRLAQNTETRGNRPTTPPITIIAGRGNARAASGPPLVQGVFSEATRASAPLSPAANISHFLLDLSKDRVPSQAEISAQGSLAGALSPVTPAEAEQYAEEVDQSLRKEGFAQGLKTAFVTPEEALALSPNLFRAAKHFDEAKKLVKKARDENREFARAIQKWNLKEFKGASQDLEEYVEKYPKSPWTPEAMIHIANYAKYTGQGDKSEDLYRKVIEMTSNDPAEQSYTVHRKAFGRLTDLYLIEKRYGEVQPMLEDLYYNDTNWSRRTWGLYWLMQINALRSDPRKLLAQLDCGTQALSALLAQTNHPHQAREVKAIRPTDPRGFSLADLRNISAKRGIPLIGFEATTSQLASLPLPVMLHYGPKVKKVAAASNSVSTSLQASLPRKHLHNKVGVPSAGATSFEHFVLLRSYNSRRDAWDVLNPQDGMSTVLTSSQLAKQWSGRGLMLATRPQQRAGKSPIPSFASGLVTNVSFQKASGALSQAQPPLNSVKQLSLPQMRATYGTGYAVQSQTNIGADDQNLPICEACEASAAAEANSDAASKGSPSVSINPLSQNLFLIDTPIWYSPSKGPDVAVTFSYNSLDASNYTRRIGGNKWSSNLGSWTDTTSPNQQTVYMPDGAQLNFVKDASGNYASPRGVASKLTRDGANDEFILTDSGGDKMIYGKEANQIGYFLRKQVDQWGNSLTYEYANKGVNNNIRVPVSILDADGKQTTLVYDSNARLIYVKTPDEKLASFSYDDFGNMIECVDVAGQPFGYSYNDKGMLEEVNTIQGKWKYVVDSAPHPSGTGFRKYKTTITNPDDKTRVIEFTTDSDGTPAQSTYHALGHYYSTDYRGQATEYSVTAVPQNNQAIAYNGRIAQEKDPSGIVTSYSYGIPEYFLPTIVDTPGLRTEYRYNRAGITTQVRQVASNGDSRTIDYIVPGGTHSIDVTQITVSGTLNGQSLSQTVYQASNFDHHQPQVVVDAKGHTTHIAYNSLGAPTTVTTWEGTVGNSPSHQTVNSYANAGTGLNRLIGVNYDSLNQTFYEYDNSGRVISATDATTGPNPNSTTGTTIRYRYNNLDALVSTTYPDGTKELTDYTCCTLPGMVTDRNGRKTYYDYNALKRMIRVQDAEGQTLQIDYDDDGNRTSLLDAKGQRTNWSYNEQERTVTKIYGDQKTEIVHMAEQGWVDSSTDGRGETILYTHNRLGDMTGMDTPSGVSYEGIGSVTSDVTWGYDALGRRVAMADGVGTTTWSYDAQNRLLNEDGPWANDRIVYNYDARERVRQIEVDRSATTVDRRIFSYDIFNRLSRLEGSAGAGNFDFSYDGQSDRVLSVSRPNGTRTTYDYEPNNLKRFLGVHNVTNAGANQSSFVNGYGYSSFKDNISHRVSTYGAEAAQTVTYNYSPTSMLTSELWNGAGTSNNPKVNQSYGFDEMGNRVSSNNLVQNTRVASFHNGIANLTSNNSSVGLNQLNAQKYYDTSSGTDELLSTTYYQYDDNGNMTQAASVPASPGQYGVEYNYVYDDLDRLVSLEYREGNQKKSKWEFVYDGLNRLRISRPMLWDATNGAWVMQATRDLYEKRRVYDGMDVVQERNTGNAIRATITRRPRKRHHSHQQLGRGRGLLYLRYLE